MSTEIKLYGHLKEATGRSSFKAEINNTAEAVRFLIANFPTLEHEMANQYYRVSINNVDIDKTELHDPIGLSEIKIVPVIAGSGRGFGKILLGAALIGLSFLSFPMAGGGMTSGLGVGFAKGFAKVSLISKSLAYVGAYLVLSGIADLFTPEVKPEAEDPLSASFSNAINTTLATVPIPIIYGEYLVGSVVISAGIETADGSPNTPNSSNVQDHRLNNISVPIDPNTGQGDAEYERDNTATDISLRRYVRIYSSSASTVKIIAVVGENTYTGTGYTSSGDELLTSFRELNQNQFNYSAPVKNGNTTYFPGKLNESIGTFDSNNRPSTGTNDGYYYGLVTGTT